MCHECRESMRKTLMCFSCEYVGCSRRGHIARHFRENRTHRFSISLGGVELMVGIDCDTGSIFCHECDDYVYDPTLEAIQRSKRIILGKRKRTAEDVPLVNGNLTSTSSESSSSSISHPPKTCKSIPTLDEY